MIGTWKGRGLVLLAAAPLLGLAPIGAGAHAAEGGVVLRTAAPKNDVLPGAAYTWAYTVTAKGPAKSGKAVFRTTLPKSLEFVSGTRHCASKGRKVVCRLGTLKDGRKVKGVIRAKVSTGARARQKITFRGVVTWGKARTARRFPAVRVAASAAFAVTETDPATSRVAAPGR